MPTGFGYEFPNQYRKNMWEDIQHEGVEFKLVIYEKVTDRIARITLNRPEKSNAFNDALYNDMMGGLHRANDDPEVRVVILRGAGANFGAGHDLSSPPGEDSPPVHPGLNPTLVDYYGFDRRRCTRPKDYLYFPKIIIAQVHGNAIGVHEFLAGYADIVVAAEDAKICIRGFDSAPDGYTYWPIMPTHSNRFRRRATIDYTGKEAAEIGFYNRAVPKEKLDEEVMKYAEALSRLPVEDLVLTKAWIMGCLDASNMRLPWRAHFATHNLMQYVRFRPYEVNFYKTKRDDSLKGWFKDRAETSKPKE